MDAPKAPSWIDVVGYQHEVLHTGVLKALLDDPDEGPKLATRLLDRKVSGVQQTRREARLVHKGGKADLTAMLAVGDALEPLAVETKVHSDGSSYQLSHTTAGAGTSHGILLALGLSALKLSRRDTADASGQEATWEFVGPNEWLAALADVELELPWLGAYRRAVGSWRDWLEGADLKEGTGLAWERDHLRFFAAVRELLSLDWTQLRSLQSGPVLTRFGWRAQGGGDIYLEFMGLRDGRRVLCLKCGVEEREKLPLVRAEVEQCRTDLASSFGPAGRRGGRSTTVFQAELGDLGAEEAAVLARTSAEVLDTRFATEAGPPKAFPSPLLGSAGRKD